MPLDTAAEMTKGHILEEQTMPKLQLSVRIYIGIIAASFRLNFSTIYKMPIPPA